MLSLENELSLLEKYNLSPTELFTIRVILLAKEDGEYEYLQRFNNILNGGFRLILETLQTKGIILKSYKIPKPGTPFIPEDVEFNKNFAKQFFRASFEMGEELFNAYPTNTYVNGQYFNLKTVSKKFDSLEQAFAKYGKYIHNNPETHAHVLELIQWGKDNDYAFTTLDRFIIDLGWNSIEEFKEKNVINNNSEAIKII